MDIFLRFGMRHALRNKVSPNKDTLEKLPVWPNSRIDELLPLTPAEANLIPIVAASCLGWTLTVRAPIRKEPVRVPA